MLCNETVSNVGGTTTAMKNHLENKHSVLTGQATLDTGARLINSSLANCSLDKIQAKINEKIIEWVILEKIPISSIEKESFANILRVLFPQFVPLSRKALRAHIIKYHGNLLRQMKVLLKETRE